jgi:hypothetical protein
MAQTRPFVSNAAMTAIAIAYRNPATAFIADQLMPRTPVMTESFKWMEIPIGDAFSVPNTAVSRRGRVPEVEFGSVEAAASVNDYGIQNVIPTADIDAAAAQRAANLSTFDPRNHAAAMLTDLMMLDREVRVAAAAQNSANYSPSNVTNIATAGDRFDSDTSDPEAVIDAALNAPVIFRPNTAAMGAQVWQRLRRQPNLVKAVRGTTQADGKITRQEFVEYFELQNLLIGEAFVNTSRPGQTPALSRVWGKSISFVYVNPMANTQGGVTWGLTAQFGSRIAGTIINADVGIKGGEVARVGEQVVELVVAKGAGALITNAIS